MVIAEALLVGMAIGAVLGLIGAGGAVVAVPAFIYLFGFSSLQATTASLAVVAVSAGTGAIPRMRLGQVRIRQALLFWGLGIVGTFVGARLAPIIPEPVIVGGFAVVMPHFYRNWKFEDLRRYVLNGIVWTAKLPVPATGVQTTLPDLATFNPTSIEPIPRAPNAKASPVKASATKK